MPFAYTILPASRLLCIRARGVVTQPERIQAMNVPLNVRVFADFDSAWKWVRQEKSPERGEVQA